MPHSFLTISWESSTPHFLSRLLCHHWLVRSLPSSGVQLAGHWIFSYAVVSISTLLFLKLSRTWLDKGSPFIAHSRGTLNIPHFEEYVGKAWDPQVWASNLLSICSALTWELLARRKSINLIPLPHNLPLSRFHSKAQNNYFIIYMPYIPCVYTAGLIPWKSSLQRGSGCFKSDINKKKHIRNGPFS